MSLIKFYLLTAFLTLNLTLFSQSKSTKYLRWTVENDMLVIREKTDRYFTSGMKLEYFSHSNEGNEPRFAAIIPTLKQSENFYGAILASNMYTPVNKQEEGIVEGDRPYAGWAYVGIMGVSNSRNLGLRLKSEYTLGAIGPITQQEKMQNNMHKLIDRPLSKGWKNQVANDIAATIAFTAEKRMVNPCDFLDVMGLVEANIGTVTNFMGIGGLVRVGLFEDYFKNVMPVSFNKNLQAFIFTRPTMRVVMDNALLQGGTFTYYRSPYVIPRDQINHYYMETSFGYSVSYRSFNMTYSQNFRTPEFKDAKNMFWGSMAFSYAF